MREPEKATEKAKDLIRMGVAKARLLQPLEAIEMKVAPAALVIGGGVVGMEAAMNLANQDFDVHLVEKESELGGLLRSINKLFPTNKEAVKLVEPLVEQVRNHPRIKTYLSSKVKQVTGFIGNFNVTLEGKGLFHSALVENRRFQHGLFDGPDITGRHKDGHAEQTLMVRLKDVSFETTPFTVAGIRQLSRRRLIGREADLFDYGLALLKTSASLVYTIQLATAEQLAVATDSRPFHITHSAYRTNGVHDRE